jgi:hypothetical protein
MASTLRYTLSIKDNGPKGLDAQEKWKIVAMIMDIMR